MADQEKEVFYLLNPATNNVFKVNIDSPLFTNRSLVMLDEAQYKLALAHVEDRKNPALVIEKPEKDTKKEDETEPKKRSRRSSTKKAEAEQPELSSEQKAVEEPEGTKEK